MKKRIFLENISIVQLKSILLNCSCVLIFFQTTDSWSFSFLFVFFILCMYNKLLLPIRSRQVNCQSYSGSTGAYHRYLWKSHIWHFSRKLYFITTGFLEFLCIVWVYYGICYSLEKLLECIMKEKHIRDVTWFS